jgi:hypothetical protein
MIGLLQPEIGRRLSSHPITDKLVMAVNFHRDKDAGAGSSIVVIPEDSGVAGDGTWTRSLVGYEDGVNVLGTWAGFINAGANNQFLWARSDFVPTSNVTVLTVYEKSDGTLRNGTTWGLNTPALYSAQCTATLPWGDGIAYWHFGGNTVGVNALETSGLTWTGVNRWVHTAGPRGMELWQNGIKVNSNAANPTRTQDNGIPFSLGARSNGSGISSDIAHFNVFAMWARQLTQDEIITVSWDPYMLWDSPSAFVFSHAQAANSNYGVGFPIFKLQPARWG